MLKFHKKLTSLLLVLGMYSLSSAIVSAEEEITVFVSEEPRVVETQEELIPGLITPISAQESAEHALEESNLQIPETQNANEIGADFLSESERGIEPVIIEKGVVFYERKEIGSVSAPSPESFKEQPSLPRAVAPERLSVLSRPIFKYHLEEKEKKEVLMDDFMTPDTMDLSDRDTVVSESLLDIEEEAEDLVGSAEDTQESHLEHVDTVAALREDDTDEFSEEQSNEK